MSADHLIPQPATLDPAEPGDAVTTLEPAVLALLTGVPAPLAAADAAVPVTDLIEAAERYQAAGRAALIRHCSDDWYQVNIEFPDPRQAEHTAATRLEPPLRHAEAEGFLDCWWYIRKTPHWRLRLHAEPPHRDNLRHIVTDVLDELTSQRLVVTWTAGIYEPETWIFGGPESMEVTHRFFHADSAHALTYLKGTAVHASVRPIPLGVRELSLLVCTALLRAAGQDWHEQGDVWQRVAQMRPLETSGPTDGLRRKVQRLLALDTTRGALTVDGHDAPDAMQPWLSAANEAGHALRELARTGTLTRGLRDVLAHHVIFHWNRLGITTAAQAILAHTAASTILNTRHDGATPPGS